MEVRFFCGTGLRYNPSLRLLAVFCLTLIFLHAGGQTVTSQPAPVQNQGGPGASSSQAQGVLKPPSSRMARRHGKAGQTGLTSVVPDKALQVLTYVRANHDAPPGFVGGRKFGNYEGQLPAVDSAGNKILYQEWDVNLHRRFLNRGPERLITSSDGRAWYTPDHYSTFMEIKDAK